MEPDVKLKQVMDVLDQLAEDTSVPRNIRRGANDAKALLLKTQDALDVRVASAIYILDDLRSEERRVGKECRL